MMPGMMRYLDRHLSGCVDFSTFYLLAIIPRKGKPAVVLLCPRDEVHDKHFNLQCGGKSLWFSSLDNMLTAAREYYGVSGIRLWWCRRRYRKFREGRA